MSKKNIIFYKIEYDGSYKMLPIDKTYYWKLYNYSYINENKPITINDIKNEIDRLNKQIFNNTIDNTSRFLLIKILKTFYLLLEFLTDENDESDFEREKFYIKVEIFQ